MAFMPKIASTVHGRPTEGLIDPDTGPRIVAYCIIGDIEGIGIRSQWSQIESNHQERV